MIPYKKDTPKGYLFYAEKFLTRWEESDVANGRVLLYKNKQT
jgi:hypothetical protein